MLTPTQIPSFPGTDAAEDVEPSHEQLEKELLGVEGKLARAGSKKAVSMEVAKGFKEDVQHKERSVQQGKREVEQMLHHIHTRYSTKGEVENEGPVRGGGCPDFG